MSACDSNIIEIIKSDAKLGTDERVSGGIELSSYAVGLETENASSYEVHIVSPSGHNGVSFNRGAGDL
jgi:hypothetical protein